MPLLPAGGPSGGTEETPELDAAVPPARGQEEKLPGSV